eukprot:scaffold215237_cov46-Prasinocladus_malaysianus.AAC.1
MEIPEETPPQINDLETQGVLTFKVLSNPNKHRARVLAEIGQLPELDPAFGARMVQFMQRGDSDPSELEGKPYLGSFGGLNWPSSYLVGRRIKERAVRKAKPHVPIPASHEVSILLDRIVYRHKRARIYQESPHRDLANIKLFDKLNNKSRKHAPERRKLGRIYQGWINLGPGNTTLTCVPGSQRDDISPERNGFSQEQDDIAEPLRVYKTFTVKPGEAVLFDPRILHKVAGGTVKEAFTRLHFGLRVAKDSLPLYLDQEDLMAQGLPPRLPSGQLVPIITSNFRSIHKDTADRWLRVNKPLRKGYALRKGGFVQKIPG